MQIPETEIIVTKEGAEILRKTVRPGDYVIGREPDCEVHLDVELVSPRHAQLTVNFDHVLIEDLGSSSGTFVNGEPVKECMRLWPNQKIQVGAATVELRRIKSVQSPDVSIAPSTATVKRLLPEEFLREKKYDIGGVVAQGGMGAILNAKEASIERVVAMKVMLDGSSPEDLTRFVAEAKVTGQLEHPNIVPVHELGVDENDQVYYTMKFVKGVTLRKVLEDMAGGDEATLKQYPLPVLLTIFQKVCDAIAFAHSKGVIHRDLKPENIMLGDFGEVLVMDWGLAKVIGQKQAPAEDVMRSLVRTLPPEVSGATLAGSVMGTPQYMSPEQARGEVEDIDARSDIYSLGAILYHMLALRPSVSGKEAWAVVAKVSQGAVEPLTAPKNRPIPDSLAAVVRKAMSFDREQRYPHVADLQRDIGAYQTGFATSAENAGVGRQLVLLVKRHKALFSTAFAAWLIITALAVWFVVRITASERRATANEQRAIANEEQAEAERNRATANEQRANDSLARLRGTAPTFFAQAQALIDKQQFADALEKINYAIELDPAEAEYHYLKGNLLEDLSRLAGARDAYAEALTRNPAHGFARANLDLCAEILREEQGHIELSKASVNQLNQLMREEGRAAEAIATTRVLGKDRQALYETWKTVFAKAGWPRDAEQLILDDDGLFRVVLRDPKLDDISFLHGIPMKSLNLDGTKVSDLHPLEGAPIRVLNLASTNVTDLSPLRGMKLTDLNLQETKVTDLNPLQGMPLEKLILVEAHGVTDLSALRGMPLKVLNLRQTKVKDIRALQGMPLVNLILAPAGGGITDYSPLKGMRLTEFRADTGFRDSDLAFLKGMPIENLVLMQSNVSDLRPLQAMPLKELTIEGSQRITDISPLANMKLAGINLDGLPVNDLSPLRGQPIESALISDIPATDFSVVSTWILSRDFRAENTKFDDLRLLAGKPIKLLNLQNTPVSDLLPLRGMKIRALFLWGTKVTSLHPVADLPDLEGLTIPTEATDVEFLRHLPNLQSLDNHRIAPGGQARPAADFWKAYPKDKEAREKLTPLMEKLRQSLTAAGVKNLKADAFTISPDWNIDADCTGASISNLGLLRGYPVDEIHLSGSGVTSLEPLRDLPIVTLHFNNTGVTDVRPLLQIPTLQYVILGKSVKDVTILREAKNLKFLSYDSINRNGRSLPAQTAAEFWEQQARLAPVIDALHKMGVKDVTAKQAALNKDGLLEIDLGGLPIGDLSPITGFPIASLNLDNTKVADLGPLRGMPLVHLGFRGAPVKDLSPLQGISLKSLTISSCPVSDLSPLKGMPLEELIIGLTDWTKPREGKTNISDLTPLRGMPLVNLSLGGVNDPDLTPLAECHNLKILVLPFPLKARNIEVLRRLSDLQRISSGWPGGDDKMPDAADFWKEYDAQQNGARK